MAKVNELVLLDVLASPFGIRVRLALAEKGLKYDYREERLSDKSPLFLEMNPIHKKIPILIHNGKPIVESLNIIQYIDEVWKDSAPLLPSDPYDRAVVRFWADFIDKKVATNGPNTWKTTGETQQAAIREFKESLKILEDFLGEKPYLGGEAYGFLDVALVPFAFWFKIYEAYGNFEINEQEYPKLVQWASRCMARQSVRKILPDPSKVHQAAVEVRKKLGLE